MNGKAIGKPMKALGEFFEPGVDHSAQSQDVRSPDASFLTKFGLSSGCRFSRPSCCQSRTRSSSCSNEAVSMNVWLTLS